MFVLLFSLVSLSTLQEEKVSTTGTYVYKTLLWLCLIIALAKEESFLY